MSSRFLSRDMVLVNEHAISVASQRTAFVIDQSYLDYVYFCLCLVHGTTYMESSLRTKTDFRLMWRETKSGNVFAGCMESC